MSTNLPNIEHTEIDGSPVVDSNDSEIFIPFYKDDMYFTSPENEVSFIKKVEQLVRGHNDYKRYIKFIREDVGIQCCQVMSNISDASTEDKKEVRLLDMHHGPILNLFDVTQIILHHSLARKEKITTFSIAERVIDEHFEHNVSVVMLSETAHEQVHLDNIFLTDKQKWGDVNRFLVKYKDGLNNSLIRKINNYVERSLKNDSYDNGVLTINKLVKEWSVDHGF